MCFGESLKNPTPEQKMPKNYFKKDLALQSIDQSYRAKTSSFCCVVCDIPLCIGERNCFLLFHSTEFEQ